MLAEPNRGIFLENDAGSDKKLNFKCNRKKSKNIRYRIEIESYKKKIDNNLNLKLQIQKITVKCV